MTDRRLEIATGIRQLIVSGLHLGRLEPGARLPSTRELAREFGVAPRAVMAAYRILEKEGLVELRKRSGIYVAPGRHTQGTATTCGRSSLVRTTSPPFRTTRPTHVMRRAHERLRNTAFAHRVLPVRRVFSDAMAGDLLRFMIQANMAAFAARSEGAGTNTS